MALLLRGVGLLLSGAALLLLVRCLAAPGPGSPPRETASELDPESGATRSLAFRVVASEDGRALPHARLAIDLPGADTIRARGDAAGVVVLHGPVGLEGLARLVAEAPDRDVLDVLVPAHVLPWDGERAVVLTAKTRVRQQGVLLGAADLGELFVHWRLVPSVGGLRAPAPAGVLAAAALAPAGADLRFGLPPLPMAAEIELRGRGRTRAGSERVYATRLSVGARGEVAVPPLPADRHGRLLSPDGALLPERELEVRERGAPWIPGLPPRRVRSDAEAGLALHALWRPLAPVGVPHGARRRSAETAFSSPEGLILDFTE